MSPAALSSTTPHKQEDYIVLSLHIPGPHVLHARTAFSHTQIPPLFFSALSVRDTVFIREQHCSAAEEVDADDGISHHWILFARPPPSSGSNETIGYDEKIAGLGEVVKGMIPAATARLVPYRPGYGTGLPSHVSGGDVAAAEPDYAHSGTWDQREPFVKVGRVATLREFRGRAYARILVQEMLDWGRKNPQAMVLKGEEELQWKGLVCAHAQIDVVPWYCKLGFELDEGMGRWWEEGIEHRGVWRRIAVDTGS